MASRSPARTYYGCPVHKAMSRIETTMPSTLPHRDYIQESQPVSQVLPSNFVSQLAVDHDSLLCVLQPMPTYREKLRRHYKVLYPYEAQLSDELTLCPGKLVTVDEENDPPVPMKDDSFWLWGANESGFTGFFYKEFVKLDEQHGEKTGARTCNHNYVTFEEVMYGVDTKPLDDLQLECIVCKNLASEPRQTICCGQTVCYKCAKKWKKRNDSCPQCRQVPLELAVDTRTKNHIRSLVVYCTHFDSGCEWKGSLSTVKDHRNKDCRFELVVCNHEACEEKIERRYLEHHMKEKCLQRPINCPCCDQYDKNLTYCELVGTHYKECSSWPMRCPNHCGTEEKLMRSTLPDHIDNNCPEQVISCQFVEAGCEVRVKRREMVDHIQQSVEEHLTAMMSDYMKVKSKYAKLQNDHEMLKQDLHVSNRAQDTLQDKYDTLKKDHDALKKDHDALEKDYDVWKEDYYDRFGWRDNDVIEDNDEL